jgi:predicted urease superfamily metal-dependent hydrolase
VKDVTVQDTIQMRMHGVHPEALQQIHALGFGPYTASQAIDFARVGVQPDLFQGLKDSGFTHPDPQDVVMARMHGVGPENLRRAKEYGSSLTLKQIIRLKQAGVI